MRTSQERLKTINITGIGYFDEEKVIYDQVKKPEGELMDSFYQRIGEAVVKNLCLDKVKEVHINGCWDFPRKGET